MLDASWKSHRSILLRSQKMLSATGNEDPKGMPSVTYGFIGIGRMGFPMAIKFRAEMPAASKFVVCDINKAHVEDFLEQSRSLGPVEVALSPKEVAEQCVSTPGRVFSVLVQTALY